MSDDPMVPIPPAAFAELHLTVSGLRSDLTRHRQEARERRPDRAPLQRAGTVPAAGPLVLDLDGPAMGRRWTLRGFGVSDAADVTTAVVGKADLFVGSALAHGPSGWRDHLDTLPRITHYDADEIVVTPTDHLIVVISGATPGQVLMARADVLDYPYQLGRPVQTL